MCLSHPVKFKKTSGLGYKVVFYDNNHPGWFYPLYQQRTTTVFCENTSPTDIAVATVPSIYRESPTYQVEIYTSQRMGRWFANANSEPISYFGPSHNVSKETYLSGFHILPSYQDAVQYADMVYAITCSHDKIAQYCCKRIVLVKYEQATQWGIETLYRSTPGLVRPMILNATVVVTQRMQVMRLVDEKASHTSRKPFMKHFINTRRVKI